MSNPIKISLRVVGNDPIPLSVKSPRQRIPVEVTAPIIGGRIIHYEGPYSVTPTQEEQILPTSGKTANEDIVVNPIPNNYGLITWNGSVLTVS